MFLLSKLFWLLAGPANLLALGLVVGTLLVFRRAAGAQLWGRRILAVVAACVALIWLTPAGPWLMMPLENRFPQPVLSDDNPPDGIIVLGGAIEPIISAAHDRPSLSPAAERMTMFVALARRFPQARLVFTGGSGVALEQEDKEASWAKILFSQLGLDPARIIFEDRSRNTYENVLFSRDLVHPKPGERWLLITSGMHMPRSVGIFRRLGWPVIPLTVDYRTAAEDAWLPTMGFYHNLGLVSGAMREWSGLLAYHLLGRTNALFPAPEASTL